MVGEAQRLRHLQLKRALARETVFNRVGREARTSSEPDSVQSAAVAALGETLTVDHAFFTYYDIPNDICWIASEYSAEGLASPIGRYTLSEFEFDASLTYSHGQTVVINDAASTANTSFTIARQALRVRASISVPIFDRNMLSATLTVAMAAEPRTWSRDEVELVEAVAAQTIAAIDAIRAARREHKIAVDLQNALLPAVPEEVPGLRIAHFMQPALDEAFVGGDFYDVFALDKGCHVLVIGDVSGKGLHAAAQLALVRNSLRMAIYTYRSPGPALTHLNDVLTAHGLVDGFVTAFVALLDSESGRLTYTSCGHEPAIWQSAADGSTTTVGETGPPLAVVEGYEYDGHGICLAVGDSLLLYTDGLSEAGPNRKEMLGTHGVEMLLASEPHFTRIQDRLDDLIARAAAHSHGAFRDDVAALLLQRI
jgi:serine phosphatase RsbU (regulator of sigma subunit)